MNCVKRELFALVLVLFCGPALAINKCTGADGRTVFQDTPCQGKGEILDVKPAAGRALPAATAGASAISGGKGTTEAQRIEAQVLTSQKERRRRDLETIETLQAAGALDTHRRGCEQEQKNLSSEQYKYRQNLYGKTHAAQVASEMAAASARCDLKDRALKEQLEALKSECIALSGCK
jgi:Domain of unknown function (DUF4124)